jgi:hypothetical protein
MSQPPQDPYSQYPQPQFGGNTPEQSGQPAAPQQNGPQQNGPWQNGPQAWENTNTGQGNPEEGSSGQRNSGRGKTKNKLVVLLAVLAVLVVGVGVADVVLLMNKDDSPTAAGTPDASSSPGAQPGTPGSSKATTPQALGDLIVGAYRENKGAELVAVICPSEESQAPSTQIPTLPPEWNATVTAPANEDGVRIQLTMPQGPTDKIFRFKQQGGSFCVTDIATG